MKKFLVIAMISVFSVAAKSQSTNGIGAIWQGIENSGLLSATNYSFEPYYTYAPSAPKHNGGGILAVYNVAIRN